MAETLIFFIYAFSVTWSLVLSFLVSPPSFSSLSPLSSVLKGPFVKSCHWKKHRRGRLTWVGFTVELASARVYCYIVLGYHAPFMSPFADKNVFGFWSCDLCFLNAYSHWQPIFRVNSPSLSLCLFFSVFLRISMRLMVQTWTRKTRQKYYCFQTLDNRHHRTEGPWEKRHIQDEHVQTCPAFCPKVIFSVKCRQGEPKQRIVVLLAEETDVWCLGRHKWIEFSGQNPGEKWTQQRKRLA